MDHPKHKPDPLNDSSAINIQNFKNALAQFATGVTVVTATALDGRRLGITANSFNSVSLNPPLILWSLANQSSSLAGFKACTHFAINVLAANQLELAQQFSKHGTDKFAGILAKPGTGGCWLLPNTIALFECRNYKQHPEGDHTIFIGEVIKVHHEIQAPLIYHNRTFF